MAQKEAGKFPAGQIPIYELPDGRMLNQSFAILRMLGRQHGYYDGSNIEESFLVDWVLETSIDLSNTRAYRVYMSMGAEPTEEDLAKSKENFAKFNA